jgi:hypothetical protein
MESNNRVRCQIMRVRLALNDLNDGDIDEEPNSPESECHLFEVVIVDNEPIPEPLSVKSDDLPEEI